MLTQTRRESAYWRDLLRRIARDMESAARTESDPRRQQWLTSRAERVRQRLLRGVPEGWTEGETDTVGAPTATEQARQAVERRARRT